MKLELKLDITIYHFLLAVDLKEINTSLDSIFKVNLFISVRMINR